MSLAGFGRAIERLFEKHKLVRRLLVFWAVGLITWVVLKTFSDLTLLTAAVATALATITALLTAVLGFYQWSRQNEDKPS